MFNRTAISILIFGLIFFVGVFALVPAYSEYRETDGELQEVQRRVKEHTRENERLKMEIQMLKYDDLTIERIARDKFGYVRPHDTVYDFSPPLPEPGRSQ